MAGSLQPLAQKFKITNDDGTPTEYFIRWAQQRQIDIGTAVTQTQLDALRLDDLADVDTTPPPTDGQALIWDAGTSEWVPGDVITNIEVDDEGTPVVTTATKLNFTGAGVTVTDGGSGQADIDIALAGTSPAWKVTATGTGASQGVTIPVSAPTDQEILVFVNGVRYETSEYSIAATTLTLTTNASGDSIEIVGALSGGGIGGSGSPYPEKTPTTPPALTNWTQQNFNGDTSAADIVVGTTGGSDGVRLAYGPVAVGNTNSVRALLRAIPGTHWRVTARLRFHGIHTSFETIGVILREASTNKSITFGWVSERDAVGYHRFTDDSTHSATLALGANSRDFSSGDFWMQVSYDGTNVIVATSMDGYYFSQIYIVAGATAGFLTTAASHLGVMISPNGSGEVTAMTRALDLLSWQEEVLA